jgi:hypothetical protein
MSMHAGAASGEMIPDRSEAGRRYPAGRNSVDWVDGFWFGDGPFVVYDKVDYHTRILSM